MNVIFFEKKANYSDKCMSNIQNTISIVKSQCEMNNYCAVSPDPQVYDNQCKSVNKYLEIKYVCV